MTRKSTVRVVIIVILILLIPLFGNLFVHGWNWGIGDFIVMGVLLFVTGLGIASAANKIADPSYRVLVCVGIVLVFLAIWSELAVDAVSQTIKLIF